MSIPTFKEMTQGRVSFTKDHDGNLRAAAVREPTAYDLHTKLHTDLEKLLGKSDAEKLARLLAKIYDAD